jgi:hypothetical protein
LDFLFFRGIAAAALAGEPRRAGARRLRRIARGCARKLERWGRLNPEFVHMAQAMRAELARLEKRNMAALAAYTQAAENAASRGYANHAALLHERKALLLDALNRRIEAMAELQRAIGLYETWGADAKVDELRALRASMR